MSTTPAYIAVDRAATLWSTKRKIIGAAPQEPRPHTVPQPDGVDPQVTEAADIAMDTEAPKAGESDARGSCLDDPTASAPLIQEIFDGGEQQAEAAAIIRRLHEEARQGEQQMDEDPALAEAMRRGLASMAETKDTDMAEALRRSLESLDVKVEEKHAQAAESAGGRR